MSTEVLYQDGSMSTFHGDGGSSHDGFLAIERLRLLTAKSALEIYIKYEGRIEVTRGGARMAIENVIAPITGRKYRRSMNGKRDALQDCLDLLAMLESGVVVVEVDDE
jgi:hypothetical protein